MPYKRKSCSVNNCKYFVSNDEPIENVNFFHFPTNPERQKKWIEFCCNPTLKNKSQSTLLRHFYICHIHFKEEDFTNYLRQRMVSHRDVIPSIFKPDDLNTNEQLTNTVIQPQPSCSEIVCTPESSNSLSPSNPHPTEIIQDQNVSETPPTLNKTPILNKKHFMNSPRKKYMYQLVKKKEKTIKRLKRNAYQRNKNTLTIKQISKLDVGQFSKRIGLIDQMSKMSRTFLLSQVRNSTKRPKGRRWSTEEKVMALAFYKKSPRMYRYMRYIFSLPCKRTLNALLEGVPFNTGINKQIFDTLAEIAKKMEPCDRACVLTFDEMSVREHLSYDSTADRIVGVEDCGGNGRTDNIANQAMVFMVCGIIKKWKQPIAFYFSKDGISAMVLVDLIREVLSACFEANLNVMATICDLGTKQVKALKILGSCKSDPSFQFQDKTIITIFDPPHLLKCTRNQLKLHDVHCSWKVGDEEKRGVASWKHIDQTYQRDLQAEPFRWLYKLTDRHLDPIGRMKLKVKLAAQVLSHSVAASIYRDVSHGLLESEAIATGYFVQFFDQLFDSMNGTKIDETKELRRVVSRNSHHMKFWDEAAVMIDSLQFESSKPTEDYQRPPSQDGWIVTIQGMKRLWEAVSEMDRGGQKVKFLVPRNINQDPLENTFGAIRSHCGSNTSPNVGQFVGAFKTSIINGLAYREAKDGMNCEEDEGTILTNLQTLLARHDQELQESSVSSPSPLNHESSFADTDLANAPKDLSAVPYVSGYIAKRVLSKFKCLACRQGLLNSNPHLFCNVGFMFKEFDDKPRLTYPSQNLIVAVELSSKLLENLLEDNFFKENIFALVSENINQQVSFEWLSLCCQEHKDFVKDHIIKSLVMIGLPWWCKKKNRANTKSLRKRNHKK